MAEHDESRLVAWGVEMRAVHRRLREALVVVREALDGASGDDESLLAARDLLVFCRGFCAALGGHHTSEDTGLFPALKTRHPGLEPVLDKLVQDHSMIAYLLTELVHAITSGPTVTELERHLDGIEAIMESHFRYEESQLLRVLDALDLDFDPRRMLGPL